MLILLIIIMVLFIILGVIMTKRIINPLSLFNLIWLIVIGLYQLRLSYLQSPLSIDTIKTLLICMISFFLFFVISYVFKTRRKSHNNELNRIIPIGVVNKAFAFWIITEIIEIIYSKGLPIIWILLKNGKTYFDFGISSVHGFMNALGLVIVMLYYYNYLKNKSTGIKNNKYLIRVIFILLFYFCLITRQVIISAVLQMIIIKLFFVKKIPWKRLLLLSFIGIIAFGLIGNLRTGYNGFMGVSMMKNSINPFFTGFYWVYMYLTMSIANINNAVVHSINGYGYSMITSTFMPSVIANILYNGNKLVGIDYLITKAFNVSGFFIEFYIAYGNLGVFIISALYGFLGGIITKKINVKNEKNILYYSVFVQVILLSFFYNHLLYLPSGFQFVIVYVMYKFFSRVWYDEKD